MVPIAFNLSESIRARNISEGAAYCHDDEAYLKIINYNLLKIKFTLFILNFKLRWPWYVYNK